MPSLAAVGLLPALAWNAGRDEILLASALLMDARQLEAFVSVVERGSLTEAARALGVMQPAISGAVPKLEGQLGFALLRR